MLGRSVGAVALAASALTVDAFLLPPGIASVEKTDNSFHGLAINPETQSIKLPCPECVFSGKPDDVAEEGVDDLFTIQGGANSVLLNFTVEEDGQKLKMNGFSLYPIPGDFGKFIKPTAFQVPASASLVEIASGNTNLQSLEISRNNYLAIERPPSPTGDVAIEFTFSIVSLDGRKVSVDAAHLTMLKDAEGRLMILNVEEVPSISGNLEEMMRPTIDEPECDFLPAFLCKAKDTIGSKVKDLKIGMPKFGGCHGKGEGKGKGMKLPTHIRPNFDIYEGEEQDRPSHHHGRPPKFGDDARPPHPHHHHGHHRHHHFMHKLAKAFVTITIPVLAGMTMGMTVSLVGMLVGRLIVFLWTTYVRGGRRGYASVAQQEDETEALSKADEVVVYVEEEPLPKYEEAPAYNEKEQL